MVRNVGNSISAQLVLNTETTILDISTKQAKRVICKLYLFSLSFTFAIWTQKESYTMCDTLLLWPNQVPYSAHYGVAADIGDSSSGSAVRAMNNNNLWKVMAWAYARTVAALWTFVQ